MSDGQTPDEGGSDTGNGAEGFKPITSQDEFDRALAKRLERERSKFADYDELKTKAAEFDKVAESQKTELQKAIERAEAAEKRAAEFEHRQQVQGWAAEIVKDSPIPAHALRGSTREELVEHFEVLKSIAVPAEKTRRTPVPPGKPAGDEKTGSRAAAALRELRRGV